MTSRVMLGVFIAMEERIAFLPSNDEHHAKYESKFWVVMAATWI